ncbi:unnamed protein product [marine sediment metagenome]|uniref:HTH cro/C1-type domain-containing protein n=1 Tax=marine sediment metagenome TaxID=412755 RepID=X1TT08_9ZZZZ
MSNDKQTLDRIIKQQRVMSGLTLRQLSDKSGVSHSHLGRIERGERFPSGHILRKITQPLGFEETELFVLADYLSPPSASEGVSEAQHIPRELEPYVASVLSQEPVEMQRTVVAILTILKSMAR